MLTEHFAASIGALTKTASTGGAKDAACFIHEFQPSSAQRSVFKKSNTLPNCLAVSETHIFAAQADKGIVHVYSRDKGNQEATVPFTEKITCLALACNDTVLILGTAEGRIFLWEVITGRQITTAQAHLQSVLVLAVDLASNNLLSGSADSTIHVWSLLDLLSFSTDSLSPLRTLSAHRSEISALALGHGYGSTNIAVSASTDQSCLVWDYQSGNLLRTFLLPSNPLCLALDPADRAIYVGYEDGSVQLLDLYDTRSALIATRNVLHNAADTSGPIQPGSASRWSPPDSSLGAALCLDVSHDGSVVLSGHQSGNVVLWDANAGRFVSNLPPSPMSGPITNLNILPVTGFKQRKECSLELRTVIKPRFGAFAVDNMEDAIPGDYALQAWFPCNVRSTISSSMKTTLSDFEHALEHPCVPLALLDDGIAELESWNQPAATAINGNDAAAQDDFMSLDAKPTKLTTLEEQNLALKKQLQALRKVQSASFDRMERIDAERKALLEREHKRQEKRRSLSNGREDHDMDDVDSDTDYRDDDSDDE